MHSMQLDQPSTKENIPQCSTHRADHTDIHDTADKGAPGGDSAAGGQPTQLEIAALATYFRVPVYIFK